MITPLPKEPEKAFLLFKAYVEMGANRSLKKLQKKLVGVSFDRLHQASSKWQWQKRLRQHIIEGEQQTADAEATAKLETARRIEQRREKIQEDAWAAGQDAIKIARATLVQIGKKMMDKPDDMVTKAPDAARLLQVGDSLCRLALGMPVSRGEITGADGAPLIGSEPPIITVIHQYDKQSKEVERIQKEFITKHPNDPAVIGRNGGRNGE